MEFLVNYLTRSKMEGLGKSNLKQVQYIILEMLKLFLGGMVPLRDSLFPNLLQQTGILISHLS